MDRHRHGLEHRCFLEGKIVGQTVDDARRNGNKLCKGPGPMIVGARNSQNLPVVAELSFSATAIAASAAVDRRLEGASISFRKSRHTGPYPSDPPGQRVAPAQSVHAPTRGPGAG